jgi:imidazole glycerol phosphate synthase glutamine amidotransferase subunit
MIAIFDYGAGNLRSVQNTLAEVGAPYTLVDDAEGLEQAEKIILPGVGHFGQMLRALDAMRVRQSIRERIDAGVPFLGICLGLQAMFAASEEAPEVKGLGIFPETVRRFSTEARVPHMGWNALDSGRPSRLLAGLGDCPYVYYGLFRNRGDEQLHARLHGGRGAGEPVRRAIPSRKKRAGWPQDR